MNTYKIRYPDGTVEEVRAEMLYYTDSVVTLVDKQQDGRGGTKFIAALTSGVTITQVGSCSAATVTP